MAAPEAKNTAAVARLADALRRLAPLLTRQQKWRALGLLCLILGVAAFEALGVGIVLPFFAMITNPHVIETNTRLARLYSASGLATPRQFFVLCVFALMALFVAKNAYILAVRFIEARYTHHLHTYVSARLLHSLLTRPYAFHLQHNPSTLVTAVTSDAHNVIVSFVHPLLTLAAEITLACLILGLLVWVQPALTALMLLLVGGSAALFFLVFKNRIARLGATSRNHRVNALKWIHQGLNSVRDVKILGRERYFVDRFSENNSQYGEANEKFQLVQQSPRLLLETVVVVAMLAIALVILSEGTDTTALVPLIAVFAAAAFRLIPSMSRILMALGQLRYGITSLRIVSDELTEFSAQDSPRQPAPRLPFEKELRLNNVSFVYETAPAPALHGIDIVIGKGQSVGIVGPSGAGKSTILCLVLGLLRPSSGMVTIDGADALRDLRQWQDRIGYIPQDVYLLDDTIRRNIAFGLSDSEIDATRVAELIRIAKLDEVVARLPRGDQTVIGERGVRLSGGQRQRIAIARALYHDPDILVMDEATSSLDTETEGEITRAIDELRGGKTIIIVTHRLSTVRRCDLIYLLHEGCVAGSGSYDSLIETDARFRRMAR